MKNQSDYKEFVSTEELSKDIPYDSIWGSAKTKDVEMFKDCIEGRYPFPE